MKTPTKVWRCLLGLVATLGATVDARLARRLRKSRWSEIDAPVDAIRFWLAPNAMTSRIVRCRRGNPAPQLRFAPNTSPTHIRAKVFRLEIIEVPQVSLIVSRVLDITEDCWLAVYSATAPESLAFLWHQIYPRFLSFWLGCPCAHISSFKLKAPSCDDVELFRSPHV